MTSSRSSRASEYTLRRRVLFHEVDWAGIVHFSNYFRYMEEAEHALWRQAGLSIARSAASAGVAFPRVEATFTYRRPLRFEDEFDVRIRIVELREKRIRYACTLACANEETASGSMAIVCARVGSDGRMKATAIPHAIADRFAVAADAEDR